MSGSSNRERSKAIQILTVSLGPSPSICLFPSLSATEVLKPNANWYSLTFFSSLALHFFFSPQFLLFFSLLPSNCESLESFQLSCHVIFAHILPCSASFSLSSLAFKSIHASLCQIDGVWCVPADLLILLFFFFGSVFLCHSFSSILFGVFLSSASQWQLRVEVFLLFLLAFILVCLNLSLSLSGVTVIQMSVTDNEYIWTYCETISALHLLSCASITVSLLHLLFSLVHFS